MNSNDASAMATWNEKVDASTAAQALVNVIDFAPNDKNINRPSIVRRGSLVVQVLSARNSHRVIILFSSLDNDVPSVVMVASCDCRTTSSGM